MIATVPTAHTERSNENRCKEQWISGGCTGFGYLGGRLFNCGMWQFEDGHSKSLFAIDRIFWLCTVRIGASGSK